MLTLDIRKPGVTPGPRWRARIPLPGTRPIKHRQYSVSEVQPVTIAAGFRCTDGVLIGADSRIEEGNVKYQQDKIFHCPDDGNVGFVIAGAGDFEPISNCVDLLRSARIWHGSTESIAALKEALRKFTETVRYQKLIERQPEPPGGFAMIIGMRSEANETDLLYLSGMDLYPIPEYRCIGAGSETALFVSKWLYSSDYSIKAFAPLAIQILRASKGHNVGCDDETHIIELLNAQSPNEGARLSLINDADFLWGLQDLLGPIIRGCVDPRIPDDYFARRLETFNDKVRSVRAGTKQAWAPMPPEVKQALESPRRDPQSPPALLE